ncbi:MAG: replicative DNA helicase [Planctomycetota bacterium]|nr:replicative DNA helicase [Planctomycetota bacterium]
MSAPAATSTAKPAAPALDARLLPQNNEAEQAVLGSILLRPEIFSLVEGILAPEDFFVRAYSAIYAAMCAVAKRGQPIDPLVLRDELERQGNLELAGGAAGLAALSAAVPTGAHAEHYARLVRSKAVLRRLVQAASEIVEKATASGETAESVTDFAERAIFDIASRGMQGSPAHHVAEVLKETWEKFEKLSHGARTVTGIATQFYDLDELTAGLHDGDLVVIAGRPAMGKTTFALNLIRHIAIEQHIPTVLFTLEMSAENIVRNLLCAHARIDSQNLRRYMLREEEHSRLLMSSDALYQAPLWIDDTPAISLAEMRSKTRLLKARHGLRLAIVDYLQLMTASMVARNRSREQEVSEISRGLKALAKELSLPVVALSQLSRKPEGRQDNRPILSDLRESGAIEQDADVVLLLHRPEYYKEDDHPGEAEVIIAKQRNGPTDKINLAFLGQYLRFENLKSRPPSEVAAAAAEVEEI